MDTGNVLGRLPKSGEWQVELGGWGGEGLGWSEFLQPQAREPNRTSHDSSPSSTLYFCLPCAMDTRVGEPAPSSLIGIRGSWF